ncbi:MAG TPA: flagellar motor switch protein FliN [Anaerolineaceae bacterium]|nr:flagellar motor switch protein FliN [Anaerolineaceae bacterium]HPN52809.1 flagellar motor switch protein FliN [Anaerolineaceae bacterium]
MNDEMMSQMGEGQKPGMPFDPANSLGILMGVSLQVTVELGRTHLTVRQVLDLQKGSVIELERIAGEPVDVYVNDRLIARGDVVVVDDRFGIRITELISQTREK